MYPFLELICYSNLTMIMNFISYIHHFIYHATYSTI